jgi:hypothetical protein
LNDLQFGDVEVQQGKRGVRHWCWLCHCVGRSALSYMGSGTLAVGLMKGKGPGQDLCQNGRVRVYIALRGRELVYRVHPTLEPRISQHFLGRGAAWVRRLLEVVAVSEGDAQLEQAPTIACMCRYGWKHARGGKFTSPALSSQPKAIGAAMGYNIPAKEPTPTYVD